MKKYESIFNSSRYYLPSGSMSSIPQHDITSFSLRNNLENDVSSSKGFSQQGNLPNIYTPTSAKYIRKPQAAMPQEDLKDWLVGKAPEPGSIGQSVQMFLNQPIKQKLNTNYSTGSLHTQPPNKLQILQRNQAPKKNLSSYQNSKLDENNNDYDSNQQQQEPQEQDQQKLATGTGRRLRRFQSELIINLNPEENTLHKQNKEPVITSLSHIDFDKDLKLKLQQEEEKDISSKTDVRKARKVQSLVLLSPEGKSQAINSLQMSSPAPRLKPIVISSMEQSSPPSTFNEFELPQESSETPNNLGSSKHKLIKLFSSSSQPSISIVQKNTSSKSKSSLMNDLQNISNSRKLLDTQIFSQRNLHSVQDESPSEDALSRSQSTHLILPKILIKPKNISSIFKQAEPQLVSTENLENTHNQNQENKQFSSTLQKSDLQEVNQLKEPKKSLRFTRKPNKQLEVFLQEPENVNYSTNPTVMFSDDSTKTSTQDVFYITKSAFFSQILDQTYTDSPQNGRSPQSRITRGILKNMGSPSAMRKKQVIFDKNLKIYELQQQQS